MEDSRIEYNLVCDEAALGIICRCQQVPRQGEELIIEDGDRLLHLRVTRVDHRIKAAGLPIRSVTTAIGVEAAIISGAAQRAARLRPVSGAD